MRYLLDTNIVIWGLMKDERLNKTALALLQSPDHAFFFSVASIWEIGIKMSIGKLKLPGNLLQRLEANDIEVLPISPEHAFTSRSLPRLHGDPFDRMLVVQAQQEDLTIMTHDKQISAYAVPTLLV